MISIDLFYKTVLTNANSDIRGNVTPTELTLILNDKVNEVFEEYLFDINRFFNRQNRGLINSGIENLPERLREKISHFSEEGLMVLEGGLFLLPENHRWTESIFYDSDYRVDILTSAKEFFLVKRLSHTKPTLVAPLGLKVGNAIKIAPASIQDKVSISYLRNPKIARWTFTKVNDAELYNPDAPDHQDIDLHPSEFNNLVVRVLQGFGQNLKESDLQNVSANEKAMDFNQENQS